MGPLTIQWVSGKGFSMRKVVSLIVMVTLCAVFGWAQLPEARTKELKRVEAAQKVLHEIMAAPDKGIPQTVLASAQCVAIVPSMLQGGFIFGARYGRGITTCRVSDDRWSAPAPFKLEGGSWGLQAGGEAVDLIMLAMNRNGMEHLINSKFKIGGEASAAAGPIGRQAAASTNWKMQSELLTYSRARGIFAGINLNGAVVKQDVSDTLALYGKWVPTNLILTGKVAPPAGTQPFLAEVHHYFLVSKTNKTESAQLKKEKQTAKTETKQERANQTAQANTGGTGGITGSASAQPSGNAGMQGSGNGAVASSIQSAAPPSTGTTTETTQQPTTNESSTGNMGMAASSNDQVQQNVLDALHNTPNLASSNVDVKVTDSDVVLSGAVPNQTDRATIRRLAEQNANGRRVVDDMVVK